MTKDQLKENVLLALQQGKPHRNIVSAEEADVVAEEIASKLEAYGHTEVPYEFIEGATRMWLICQPEDSVAESVESEPNNL